MLIRIAQIIFYLAITTLISSCGGGGGGASVAEGGIGGTGISTGTITGFGSVYVNGVKYETTAATFTGDDNESANQAGLRKGMVVTVKGTINTDGVTGVAKNIKFEDLLEGPITSKGTDTLVIMGHTVKVSASTQYEGTDFSSLSAITPDVVEVSGFYDANRNITATYIELTSSTVHEITGEITATGSGQFTLNNVLSVNSSATVSVGDYVEVKGSYSAAVLTATSVDPVIEGYDVSDRDDAELEGLALGTCDPTGVNPLPCQFTVNGITVEIDSSTQFDIGSHLDIADAVLLEIEGSLVSDVLIAEEVEFKNEAKVEGQVAPGVTDNGVTKTVTLVDMPGLEIVVDSDPAVTEFNVSSYALIDSPEHLRFVGKIMGNQLIASRVDAGSSPDVEVEAIVESYVSGTSVTVMGVTVSTSGLTFKLDDGTVSGKVLTSTQFYDYLLKNEAKVQVKGIVSGGSTVTWTEIELDL